MASRMCRTCLSLDNLKCLNETYCDGYEISTFQMLVECYSKKNIKPEFLICLLCISKIKTAYEFHKDIENADKVFEKLYSELELKYNEKIQVSEPELNDDPTHTNMFKLEESVCGKSADHLLSNDSINVLDEKLKRKRKNYNKSPSRKQLKIKRERIKQNEEVGDDKSSLRTNCSTCGKTFRNASLLQLHMDVIHGESRTFPCNQCPLKFTLAANRRRHVLTAHEKVIKFHCDRCFATYSTKRSLMEHIKRIHTENAGLASKTPRRQRRKAQAEEVACDLCNKEFVYFKNYRMHTTLRHKNENGNFGCDACAEEFPTIEALRFHRDKVHPSNVVSEKQKLVKKFDCETCKKSYIHWRFYQEHLKFHNNTVQKYRCDECEKECLSLTGLNHHKSRVHTGIQTPPGRVLCAICGKSFKSECFLRMHFTVHTGERTMQCHYCEKMFRTNMARMVHERIHEGIRKYKCEICTKSFVQPQQLIGHIRTHTGERPYKCPYCDKRFALNGNLTVHKRIHTGELPFKCNVCEKGFNNSSAKKKHMSVHKTL